MEHYQGLALLAFGSEVWHGHKSGHTNHGVRGIFGRQSSLFVQPACGEGTGSPWLRREEWKVC